MLKRDHLTTLELAREVEAMEAQSMTRQDAFDMLDLSATYINRAAVALQRDPEAGELAGKPLLSAWTDIFEACRKLRALLEQTA